MFLAESVRVGYVVKRYPRYSETFIVSEILAHEAVGLEIEIFSLRHSNDACFQDVISKVRSPVSYLSLPEEGLKGGDFWKMLDEASELLPGLLAKLELARGEETRNVYQAVLLARQVRLKDIRHLHAHFASSATSVARLAAHFAEVPYTFTAHAKDIFHQSVKPDDLQRKLNDAARVITVSDYNLGYLCNAYGSHTAHIERIYNGLDLEKFPYQEPNDRPPLIVSVGRLIEKKGFSDLIGACSILARRGCSFSCHIIGNGPLETDLHAQIERLGLQTKVQLVGPQPQGEVIKCIQNAAVFAVPCVIGSDGNRDGLPTVLLEAMALGTPCISTDVTGIPEVVLDGETGLMVPQHDPLTLAAAIEGLLNNSALRVRLAIRARRLIEKEFDIYQNTAYLRSIFQEVNQTTAKASQGVY